MRRVLLATFLLCTLGSAGRCESGMWGFRPPAHRERVYLPAREYKSTFECLQKRSHGMRSYIGGSDFFAAFVVHGQSGSPTPRDVRRLWKVSDDTHIHDCGPAVLWLDQPCADETPFARMYPPVVQSVLEWRYLREAFIEQLGQTKVFQINHDHWWQFVLVGVDKSGDWVGLSTYPDITREWLGLRAWWNTRNEVVRKPVVAGRPHTMTLAFVEKRSMNARRGNRSGWRIVVDISPPVAVGEEFRFDLLCRPKSQRGDGWDTMSWPFNEHGQHDGRIENDPSSTVWYDTISGHERPIAGIETWLSAFEPETRPMDYVRINGKRVYGKEPKP